MKFKQWFNTRLTVGGFPYIFDTDFENKDYDIVINVSDEWYHEIELELRNTEDINEIYWFPMNEKKRDVGLNSIYGAMFVLANAYYSEKTVYLHCHAGINRSQTVADAFYYIITGIHRETQESGYINKLIAMCHRGYLPPKAETESFLRKIKDQLAVNIENKKQAKKLMGGKLDEIKISTIKNF